MPGGVQGMKYTYRDAAGKQLVSLVSLPCPTFVGDTPGAVAENRARIRGVDGRVDDVEADVQEVTEDVESLKSRLDRLEAENSALREQVETKMPLDMETLSVWLEEQIQVRLAHVSSQVVEIPAEGEVIEEEVIDVEVVEIPEEVVELERVETL